MTRIVGSLVVVLVTILAAACEASGDGTPDPSRPPATATPQDEPVTVSLTDEEPVQRAAVTASPGARELVVVVQPFANPGRAVAVEVTAADGKGERTVLGAISPFPSSTPRSFGLAVPAGLATDDGHLDVALRLLPVDEGEDLPTMELHLELFTR